MNDLKMGNVEFKEGVAIFKAKPQIYPLDVLYAAAYMLLEKAFITFDGDPEKEILVEIRPKTVEQDLKKIVCDFNDEVINYAMYKIQNEKNADLREAILKRVLLTNDLVEMIKKNQEKNKEPLPQDEEGIFKEWEEVNPEDEH